MKRLFILLLPLALICSCGKVELSENDGKGNPNNPENPNPKPDPEPEPDPEPDKDIFLQYCIGNYDTDGDGTVSQYEADQVTSIDCADMGIVRLTDIGKFSNLEMLDCSGNSLVSLDLSKNRHIISVDCKHNSLREIILTGCSELEMLDCSNNSLATLDVGSCSSLQTLDCSYNSLTALDLSGATGVVTVNCKRNSLTSLTLTGCSRLESLDCSYNSLTSLDVSECPNLSSLDCTDNQLLTELWLLNNLQQITDFNKDSNTEIKYYEHCYSIGDFYSQNGKEGIVFWITEGGRHGKIVTTDKTICEWSTEYVVTGAADENYGMANMKKIQSISGWHEKYPAFAWCADKGEGWYLPAKNELKTLYESNAGGLRTFCWSSTEEDCYNARGVNLYSGDTSSSSYKSYDAYLCAVCAF